MEKLIGKIIRIDLDIYVINIQDTNNIVFAKARGNAKKNNAILVGDIVEVEKVKRNRTNNLFK